MATVFNDHQQLLSHTHIPQLIEMVDAGNTEWQKILRVSSTVRFDGPPIAY